MWNLMLSSSPRQTYQLFTSPEKGMTLVRPQAIRSSISPEQPEWASVPRTMTQ